MGIGVGIFLLALGAILSFGVSDPVEGIDLEVIGYILMGAGLIGIVIGLIMMQQRTHTSHTHREERQIHED